VHYEDITTITTSSAFSSVTALATTQKITSFVQSGSDSILTLELTLTSDLGLATGDDVDIIIDMWTLPSALWSGTPTCSTGSTFYNIQWQAFTFTCATSTSGLKTTITLTINDMFDLKDITNWPTGGDWLLGEVFTIPITISGFDISSSVNNEKLNAFRGIVDIQKNTLSQLKGSLRLTNVLGTTSVLTTTLGTSDLTVTPATTDQDEYTELKISIPFC